MRIEPISSDRSGVSLFDDPPRQLTRIFWSGMLGFKIAQLLINEYESLYVFELPWTSVNWDWRHPLLLILKVLNTGHGCRTLLE